MSKEASILLFGLLTLFGFIQFRISWIGNRPYSMYYKSYGLLEKRSILKLIYFKPKHFHRFSVWEVVFFFYSYFILIVLGTLFGLGFAFSKIHQIGLFTLGGLFCAFIIAEIVRVSINDIQERQERKYRNSPEPDLKGLDDVVLPRANGLTKGVLKSLFIYSGTIRAVLEDLYSKKVKKAKGDKEKIDAIDKEFIQYYRDYKKIYIEKDKIIYK